MKITLTEAMFINETRGYLSRKAAAVLYAFLEETNPESEFDLVELRSQFTEYGGPIEAALDMGWQPDDAEFAEESDAIRYLEGNYIVIPFDGGVIIGE
jgi:hypothetical protein